MKVHIAHWAPLNKDAPSIGDAEMTAEEIVGLHTRYDVMIREYEPFGLVLFLDQKGRRFSCR